VLLLLWQLTDCLYVCNIFTITITTIPVGIYSFSSECESCLTQNSCSTDWVGCVNEWIALMHEACRTDAHLGATGAVRAFCSVLCALCLHMPSLCFMCLYTFYLLSGIYMPTDLFISSHHYPMISFHHRIIVSPHTSPGAFRRFYTPKRTHQ
jgi:hypothetical protein